MHVYGAVIILKFFNNQLFIECIGNAGTVGFLLLDFILLVVVIVLPVGRSTGREDTRGTRRQRGQKYKCDSSKHW